VTLVDAQILRAGADKLGGHRDAVDTAASVVFREGGHKLSTISLNFPLAPSLARVL
jgi:hypothetical protein